jgi:excisionase family DNA binding protein
MALSPILFDPDEAAELLHVSRRWLLSQLRSGALPARKIAGRWMLSLADLDEIVQMSAVGGSDA